MRTTAAGQSALLMLDVVEVLDKEKTEYAVIGAIAASIHGAIRASMDADLVLALTVQKAADLEKRFQATGFTTSMIRGDLEDPVPAMLKVNDVHGNRVDLLIGLRGMDPEAFSRTIRVPFHGQTLRFIGREDFIASKAFAGGPKDIQDAERAVTAAKDSLDKELLKRLVKRYGRDAVETLDLILKRDGDHDA